MTTVKQLEKRVEELEDKIDKLIKVVNTRFSYPPYEKPKPEKCPCCGRTIKTPYNPYQDKVIW